MSQDSRVFFRIFFGIGLVLILISVVIFITSSPIAKTRFILKASLLIPSGTPVILIARVKWFVVSRRCLSSDARLHANFQFEYWQRFYEDSEGDKVNVYYSP